MAQWDKVAVLVLLGVGGYLVYKAIKDVYPDVKEAVVSAGLANPEDVLLRIEQTRNVVKPTFKQQPNTVLVLEQNAAKENVLYKVNEREISTQLSPFERGMLARGEPIEEVVKVSEARALPAKTAYAASTLLSPVTHFKLAYTAIKDWFNR